MVPNERGVANHLANATMAMDAIQSNAMLLWTNRHRMPSPAMQQATDELKRWLESLGHRLSVALEEARDDDSN